MFGDKVANLKNPKSIAWGYIQNLTKGRSNADRAETNLATLNTLFEGHGIEALRSETEWDNYWGDTVATYINMGDLYIATFIYDRFLGKIVVGDLGWFLESRKHLNIR